MIVVFILIVVALLTIATCQVFMVIATRNEKMYADNLTAVNMACNRAQEDAKEMRKKYENLLNLYSSLVYNNSNVSAVENDEKNNDEQIND